MKQKEKEILLKTFCSLLLYNGYFSHCNKIHRLKTIELDGKDTINNKYPVEICYPYLRPMLSMTEDERKFYYGIVHIQRFEGSYEIDVPSDNPITTIEISKISEVMDWLNKHHFDYRGLIPKGLAIEAPEGMYNNKTE